MTMFTKIFAGAAGLTALAAAPAAAQYGGYSPYAPYGNAYGYYGQANVTQMAAQQCAAAVQARLNNRVGIAGILGSVLGAPMATTGRVLSVTQVRPRDNRIRVRGLANSGQSPYGIGAYGAMGYAYQPDLSFTCDVDYRGRVRDVDINRRR